MKSTSALPILLLFAPLAGLEAAGVDCLDTDNALDYWRPIKAEIATSALPADNLARDLVSCLGSPDPELRDRIAYEMFTYWLRQEKLTDDTRSYLLSELSAALAEPGDDMSLKRSFSALVLAELMRSDANRSFMPAKSRQALLDAAALALIREVDFRGLEPDIGWVHPVAHMADLLWRFSLHPATSAEQANTILQAVDRKITPPGVFYRYNESDRLARAISTLISRKLVEPGVIADWLDTFQSPRSMEKWAEAFQSPAGMAELHNTKQFLRALSDQLAEDEVDTGIREPLDALVKGFTLFI
jgi:hypothetical protein